MTSTAGPARTGAGLSGFTGSMRDRSTGQGCSLLGAGESSSWWLYHDHSAKPIQSFGNSFMRGVCPTAWNEEWANAIEGSAS